MRATGEGRGARGGWVARLTGAVRRIAGMPDYAAYLAHCREHHPDRPVPCEREYFDDYLRQRYEGGPTRCC